MKVMLIFAIAGYVCGSFMSAYYIPQWLYDMDVARMSDDGNPGAANVFKNAGVPCGILVLAADLLKGYLPVHMALNYIPGQSMLIIPVLIAPVLGHAYPVFRRFRGGKAIAVSFGVLIGLAPDWVPALCLAFFYILFSVVRINPHSRRSIITFTCWWAALAAMRYGKSVCIAAVIISAVVVHKHVRAEKKSYDICNC